jgi:hypothetical protein
LTINILGKQSKNREKEIIYLEMQKPEKVQKEEIHHYDQSEMKIPII